MYGFYIFNIQSITKDISKEYWILIFFYFIETNSISRTPVPCINITVVILLFFLFLPLTA
jgi:tRNA U34 2-thiouridine synthase MnmA/TrmU